MADATASIIGARIALATAGVAGLAAVQQPLPIEAMWGGVKLAHLIFGCVGAALTLSVVRGWTWPLVGTTLVTGLGAAAFATPFALHYLPPPTALATIGESAR